MSNSLLSQAEIDALLSQIPKSPLEQDLRQDDSERMLPVARERTPEPGPSRAVTPPAAEHPNLERILDIPLQLKVLLGKVAKSVSAVTSLAPGAIVEFERNVSEPVDILLNGKLIARGEVVVVDEHFGIRITQIVSPQERVRKMV